MIEKKNEMKFTILFSPANPDHIYAANKLNAQSRNNKANYIALAIKFYEENNCLDMNIIEKTVIDILNKNKISLQTETIAEKYDQNEFDAKLKESINSSLQIFKNKT